MDVNWGFIGAGYIARSALAPAVHAATGARLLATAARDEDRALALGGQAHSDYQAIIDDPDVEVVYISLPNHLHLHWTLAALGAGKHVVCEKPLGMNGEEVRAMRDAQDASGCLLIEATWNRWHPRTRRAEALIRSGSIGRVTSVETTFHIGGAAEGNYRYDPAMGGGALYDLGCYNLVAALWATDARDAELLEADLTMGTGGADLSCSATLLMNGAEVRIACAFVDEPRQSLRITGTLGELDFLGNDAIMSRDAPSSLHARTVDADRIEHFAPVDPYQLMVENVSAAVRGLPAFLPPEDESARMISVVDLILGSGRTW